MKRLKVLMSAYACEPGKNSEPGVGWNMAREMAKYHAIWVITRANNRSTIKAELTREYISNLHFVYYNVPRLTMWWKRGERGIQLYYYLWQIGIYFIVKRLHRKINFNLLHHVTFAKYWAPSFIFLLSPPFIWGPIGGGESAPKAFWPDFSLRGNIYERVRTISRWLGMHDPFVRITARRSSKVLVSTRETALQVHRLKARGVKIFGLTGLSQTEINRLSNIPIFKSKTIRFISVGRLLHFKGFHPGLRAFAEAKLPNAEYWIIGDGPERERIEILANKLNISKCVRFWCKLSRENTLSKLTHSHILIHPSLHDSGCFVCLEAMASGKPVIFLELSGPARQVTDETGICLPAETPEQVVKDMAEALRRLAEDVETRKNMGLAGRERVKREFTWKKKGNIFNKIYNEYRA